MAYYPLGIVTLDFNKQAAAKAAYDKNLGRITEFNPAPMAGGASTGLVDYTANATKNYGVDQASGFSLGSGGTYYDAKSNKWMDKNLIFDDDIIPANELTFDQSRAVDPSMTQEQYNATRKLDIGGESASKAFGNYASGIGALGQVGLGALSYLENQKTADAQRKLLGQQYASNATTMENSAADRKAAMKAFGVA